MGTLDDTLLFLYEMRGAAKGVSGGRATTRGESRSDRVTVVMRSVRSRGVQPGARECGVRPMALWVNTFVPRSTTIAGFLLFRDVTVSRARSSPRASRMIHALVNLGADVRTTRTIRLRHSNHRTT